MLPEPDLYQCLTIQTDRQADRYVIAPAGELERANVELLESAVRDAEATDAQRIVLDLSGLRFIDTTGLRLLLAAQARSSADSDRLRLVPGPRRVQRVFQLTNTEQMLPFFDSEETHATPDPDVRT